MKTGVIGLGGTGSAALRFLADAGHEVHGFEQFRIGHDRGSSHGQSRIIRYTYADPIYTRMMGDAYPLWYDLEADAGETLLVQNGGLFFGPSGHPEMKAAERSLVEGGRTYEVLDADVTHARYPAFHLKPEEVAIFQADSGLLRASACVAANIRLAAGRGATVHENAPITALRRGGRGVSVHGADGSVQTFDSVLITAGPWTGKLLADQGLPLVVTRQEIVYLRIARKVESFQPDRFPVWIDASSYEYGFPSDGAIAGVKIAAHRRGERVDPDSVRRTVDETYIAERVAYARVRFPDLDSAPVYAQVCLYTNTPDEGFIVDAVPDLPGVWLVSGCSGHGFKFTVLLGKIGASLISGRRIDLDPARFSLSRFH